MSGSSGENALTIVTRQTLGSVPWQWVTGVWSPSDKVTGTAFEARWLWLLHLSAFEASCLSVTTPERQRDSHSQSLGMGTWDGATDPI